MFTSYSEENFGVIDTLVTSKPPYLDRKWGVFTTSHTWNESRGHATDRWPSDWISLIASGQTSVQDL